MTRNHDEGWTSRWPAVGELDELAHALLLEGERLLWLGRGVQESGWIVGADGRETMQFGEGTIAPEEQRDKLARAAARGAARQVAWLRVLGRAEVGRRRLMVAIAEDRRTAAAWGFGYELDDRRMCAGAWYRVDPAWAAIRYYRVLAPQAA